MNSWIIILLVLCAVSLLNTVLIIISDNSDIDERNILIFMGGIFVWIILLIKNIVYKIKRGKNKGK